MTPPLDLFMARVRELREARGKATTGPWKVEANTTSQISGDNWPVSCGFGQSATDNLHYAVVTDEIPASEVDGDAKTDAAFVVLSRNLDFEEVVEAMGRKMDAAAQLLDARKQWSGGINKEEKEYMKASQAFATALQSWAQKEKK